MPAFARSSRHPLLTCWLAAITLLTAGCGGESIEVDLPPADHSIPQPEQLSSVATSALDSFLDFNVWIGSRSGFIALFARDGHVVYATTAGYADIEAKVPMALDQRVRIASMTKPITAVAALQLIEEGRLRLDDPVERYIFAAANLRVATSENVGPDGAIPTEPLTRPVTVRDLLTFSSGFGDERYDSDLGRLLHEHHIYLDTGTLEERIDRALVRLPLFEQPGERWRYGWSADVLARVIEVAAGQPFDEILAQRIFEPLGMKDSSFVPPPEQREGMATIYTQDENGDLVRAEPVLWDPEGWTPGGGGLMSTATDYMRFALMLWNRGTYDGVKILEPESVELMTQLHVSTGVLAEEDIEGLGWGLGLAVVADSDATPTTDRDGDFWWAGYYGTTFFVSPESGLVGVVISQNQPSETSGRPYAVHLAQSFAFFGL